MQVTQFFECTVSYVKMMENGVQKKVSEPYVVNALSFTEAEAVIIEYIRPYITGEFIVKNIKRCKCNELVPDANGDRYYNMTIAIITLDEKSGKEKKTRVPLLVQAADMQKAMDNLKEHLKGSLSDYDIVKTEESKVIDVVLDIEVKAKS